MSHSDFLRSEMSRHHHADLAREAAEIRAAREQGSGGRRPALSLGVAAAWKRFAAVLTRANPLAPDPGEMPSINGAASRISQG
ncbi:MAG TPA: hypothetical protein VGK53_10485 [Propionicimonas sp.]